MGYHRQSLSSLKRDYDMVLTLARYKGVALLRHPEVSKLKDGRIEDIEFLEALIDRICDNCLVELPVRGRKC
jgi:hypothetical protein